MFRIIFLYIAFIGIIPLSYSQVLNKDDSLLIKAVTENNLPLAESLLKKGGNVNLQDPSGLSLMHIAAKENFSDLLTLLIRMGANMDITTHYGNTPLELAVYASADLCAYLLINSGANINAHGSKDGGTPIQYAVIKTQPALFMHLLRKGADLTIQNKAGYTITHQMANNETFAEALHKELNSPYNRNKYDNLYGSDYNDPHAILDTLFNHGAAFFKRDTQGYRPLHLACKTNNKILVDYLLKNGDNINDQENTKKETPLICAIQNNHEDLALKLIRKGADIRLVQTENWSALHYAARDGWNKAALEILKRKPDVQAQMIRGWTALHLAAWNKQFVIVNLLLLNGATDSLLNEEGYKASDLARQQKLDGLAAQIENRRVNLVELYHAGLDSLVHENIRKEAKPDLSSTDSEQRTLLHAAVAHFDIPFIKLLLQKGAAVNAQDAEGKTPLMIAIDLVLYEEPLQLLLKKSNINLGDRDGNTVLHLAAGKNDPKLLALLLQNKANPNQPNKENLTPFELACSLTENVDIIRLFVESGAKINPVAHDHFSPLMLALQEKYFSTAIYLLEKGADINFKTANHLTPLHIITAKSFGKFLPVALKKGAVVNIQTTDSLFSPLHFAAENGRSDMVKILTWHSANLQAKNILGKTALDVATLEGNEDVIQYLSSPTFDALEMIDNEEDAILAKLIREGRITNIYQKNEKGENLLHLAVLADSKELAGALLEKNFNLNEKDFAGNTPLLFALKTCNTNFAAWLLQKGANAKLPDLRGETPYSVCVRRNYADLKLQLEKRHADTLVEIKKEPALIFPHITAGEIYVARYSPDGKTMLSAGENNLVLWDTKTARIIKVFENVSKSISDIAFSPDGKIAATVEGKGNTLAAMGKINPDWKHITLWDLQTCRFLKKITLADGLFLQSVVFSGDGKRLLVTARFGGLQIYSAGTGKLLAQCGNRDEDYANAVWVNGNKEILTASGNQLEWWNPASNRLIKKQVFPDKIKKIVISASESFAAIGHQKGMLLFDLNAWKTIREFDCSNKEVNDVAISADNRQVAANCGFFLENFTRVFKTGAIEPIHQFTNQQYQVTSLCFSPDGKNLMGTDAKAQVLEWALNSSNDLFVQDENANHIALSGDGQFLFIAESKKTLTKRSATDLTLLETYDTIHADLFKLTMDEQSDRCFLVSHTGKVLNYDLRTRALFPDIAIEGFPAVAAIPINDSLLILASRKGEIVYWHLQQNKIIRRWGHDDSANIIHAKLSPDKKRLALGGTMLKIADLETFQTISHPIFRQHGMEYISEISFLKDPEFILASIMVRGMAIISLKTGKITRNFKNEISHIRHKLTPDGDYAISNDMGISSANNYSLVNLESGETVYKSTVYDDFGHHIALSSSGSLFISTDKGIYKKQLDPEQVSRSFKLTPSRLSITHVSPDAACLTFLQDSVAYTLDLRTFKKEKIDLEDGAGIQYINEITDGGNVEIYTKQNGIQYWNFREGKISHKIADFQYPLKTSVTSADGSLVATGDFTGTIRIKNLANDSLIRLITMEQIPVSMALSADNKLLYVASNNLKEAVLEQTQTGKNLFTIWSVETGKKISQPDSFLTPLPVIKLLRNDSMLVSLENPEYINQAIIRIYRLKEGLLHTITRHDGSVSGIGYSHDTKKMLFNLSGGGVVVYDIDSLKGFTIPAHEAPVVASAFSPDDRFIYSAAADNTVKIWDAVTAKLVSTIYLASDSTRMVIGPDNYYACSKEIIKDFGWQVDNRRFEFDQFDLAYNRPDLAYRSLPDADTSELPMYYKAWKKRLEKMNYREEMLSGEFHVPEITITNRDKLPFKTSTGKVTLEISAGDSKYRVSRLNAWVNGVPLYGLRGLAVGPVPLKTVKQIIPLNLSQGMNKIEVSVTNEKGTESLKETVLVRYTPSQKRVPDLYLLTIGASEYEDSTMNLVYAAKDAKDISSLFKLKTDLYNRVHSFILLNREVTKENLSKLKDSLLASQPDDVVLIFYAGHGLPDKNLDYFLASWNTDFANPAANGIPYEMLENLVDSIPARNKLILLDACFSGEADKTAEIIAETDENKEGKVNFRAVGNTRGISVAQPARQKEAFELMKLQFADLRRSTGALVISSAGSGEFAFEGDSWKNGVFTYSLLDGLISGKAEVFPTNTGISANELSAYLMERVKVLTQGRQTPTNRREKVEFDFRIW